MNTLPVIDTPAQLRRLVDDLRDAPWLAVDTEFYRERTYRPQLCLLQIATPERFALVDAIRLRELNPLIDLLYTPGVIKVLHSARQDLELFYWMRGSVPTNLFDTQLAAPYLGHPQQMGYAALVSHMLEVELDKAYTRIDWRKRPLPEAALQYAADDVTYLAQVYPLMRDELDARGQFEPFLEAQEVLTRAETYDPPSDELWRRIRGADRLKGDGQAIIQALASWREQTARRRDIPRGWLMKDGVLLGLSRRAPTTKAQLRRIKGLGPSVIKRDGETLLRIIAQSPQPAGTNPSL